MADKYQTNQEQVRPLAIPSPTIHPTADDEESGDLTQRWRSSSQYLKKRRSVLWCCGCCGATVVILGVIILVLALTVFKVKDPELTMNSLHIDRLLVPGIGTLDNPISLNATLTADISIKNPNVASFKFHNSTTDFYYGGEKVGVAHAPNGKVKARRTVRMNVTVDVLADRLLLDTSATGDVIEDGGVNMSSFTDITGQVNLLGIYKRDLDILLNCTFRLDIIQKSLDIRVCQADVK